MLRGDVTSSVDFPMPFTSSTEAAASLGSAPIETMQPAPAGLTARPSKSALGRLAVGTALGGLAVGVVWFAIAADRAEADPEARVTGSAATTPAVAGRQDLPRSTDAPDASALDEIDRLTQSGELDGAEALLVALRDQHPKHPQVSWRWGRLLAKRKGKKAQALAAYGDAMEADPTLLDDKHFYGEVHDLLQIPALRDDGLDLALRYMGKYAHTFLLELVNNEKKPLTYENRQRALEELATDSSSWALVNRRLNIALDVLQARQSLTPCQAYDEALTNVAAMPDYWFYSRVERSEVPPADANAKSGREDPVLCATLPQRKADTLELLSALAPEPEEGAEGEAPADGKAPANRPSKSTSTKKAPTKQKPSPKKVDCNKFRGIFKKQCWE
jgi:hypothetical protein